MKCGIRCIVAYKLNKSLKLKRHRNPYFTGVTAPFVIQFYFVGNPNIYYRVSKKIGI